MARFARDCMFRARELTKKLEVSLGPDTGDLMMRMGLHSGPVTAGVLRGERSRFQVRTNAGDFDASAWLCAVSAFEAASRHCLTFDAPSHYFHSSSVIR